MMKIKSLLYFFLVVLLFSCSSKYVLNNHYEIYQENLPEQNHSEFLNYVFTPRTGKSIQIFSDGNEVKGVPQTKEDIFYFRIPKGDRLRFIIDETPVEIDKKAFEDFSSMSIEKSGKTYKVYFFNAADFHPGKTGNFSKVQY